MAKKKSKDRPPGEYFWKIVDVSIGMALIMMITVLYLIDNIILKRKVSNLPCNQPCNTNNLCNNRCKYSTSLSCDPKN